MNKIVLASIAAVPLLLGCESTSVGVGVGGVSGNTGVGVDVSATTGPASARTTGSQLTVSMFKIDEKGVGPEIGALMFQITRKGMRIEPALGGLPPGEHGFHIHEKPDCGPGMKDGKMAAGMAAGGHFDPTATGKHLGPMGPGHRGDMPIIKVDANGNATEVMFVLRLGIDDLRGHAIMIHEGGDNYSDQPKPLGGGGPRIACGIVS